MPCLRGGTESARPHRLLHKPELDKLLAKRRGFPRSLKVVAGTGCDKHQDVSIAC